jgi:hypothetical protein
MTDRPYEGVIRRYDADESLVGLKCYAQSPRAINASPDEVIAIMVRVRSEVLWISRRDVAFLQWDKDQVNGLDIPERERSHRGRHHRKAWKHK